MNIFADVCFLVKHLQAAIIPNQNIQDNITIVVALDFLYNDFKTTITSMFEWEDKTIEKIQQILASAKAKFINKCTTGMT